MSSSATEDSSTIKVPPLFRRERKMGMDQPMKTNFRYRLNVTKIQEFYTNIDMALNEQEARFSLLQHLVILDWHMSSHPFCL